MSAAARAVVPATSPQAKPVAGPRAAYASPQVQQTVAPLGLPPIGPYLLVARTDQLVAVVDTRLDPTHPKRTVATARGTEAATKIAQGLVEKGAR